MVKYKQLSWVPSDLDSIASCELEGNSIIPGTFSSDREKKLTDSEIASRT